VKLSGAISRERRIEIDNEVARGSHPRRAFFFMVALSTLIASFGLLMDSTAVVIGAMLVDERLSPALPGVAISTAIVPPLANAGLSASLGSYEGAWGSFLLFFTNFLSILLASAAVFTWAGMGGRMSATAGIAIARRFGVALAGFLVVGFFLTSQLGSMIEDRRLSRDLRVALAPEFDSLRVSKLEKLVHRREDDRVVVLAHVHAPRVPAPRHVKATEGRLERAIGLPVELFVRTTLTKSVSASGSIDQGVAQTLDGFKRRGASSPRIRLVQRAEQLVREFLGDRMGFELEGIETFPWGEGLAVVAEVSGPRQLRNAEIAALDDRLQAEAEEPLVFGVTQAHVDVRTRQGSVRFEFSSRTRPDAPERERFERVLDVVATELGPEGYSVVGSSQLRLEDGLYCLLELVGPAELAPERVQALQRWSPATRSWTSSSSFASYPNPWCRRSAGPAGVS
jgi:hypothetical protein